MSKLTNFDFENDEIKLFDKGNVEVKAMNGEFYSLDFIWWIFRISNNNKIVASEEKLFIHKYFSIFGRFFDQTPLLCLFTFFLYFEFDPKRL